MPRSPLKSLSLVEVLSHAVGISLKEAELDGILTPEQRSRISDRADAIVNALREGKVIDIDKAGRTTIRDAEPDEEEELSSAEDFPFHHAARTTLDI